MFLDNRKPEFKIWSNGHYLQFRVDNLNHEQHISVHRYLGEITGLPASPTSSGFGYSDPDHGWIECGFNNQAEAVAFIKKMQEEDIVFGDLSQLQYDFSIPQSVALQIQKAQSDLNETLGQSHG